MKKSICVQINSKEDYDKLMHHFDSKGWVWCSMIPASDKPWTCLPNKMPNYISYENKFVHGCVPSCFNVKTVDEILRIKQ